MKRGWVPEKAGAHSFPEVDPLTREELQAAIDHTKEQIYQIKQLIIVTTDHREKRRLKRRLKELQYLQLWHIDQLKGQG